MAENLNTHIGNKLRERRSVLGLSQGAIAKELGITSQQVQKYEKGINAMNAERIYEFSKFLKVPVVYFFEGFNEKPISIVTSKNLKLIAKTLEPSLDDIASDRESIEILKSFKLIKDKSLRKRLADLLRSLSLKEI